MKFPPRDFQIDAYNQVGRLVASGKKRVVIKAPTGVGKTYIAAMITERALEKGNRVAFIAPYSVLINQTVDRFMEQGLPLPGVMQGAHELTDATRPIQIATAQTLGRRDYPQVDVVIVDEAHLQYSSVIDWMKDNPELIFIGLTATPFSKGMGKNYQDMVKIKSLRECLNDGTLSPYVTYGVEKPDLSNVTVRAGEYVEKEISEIMGDAKLVGNITKNWLANGENRQTIVFAVNVLHANQVTNDFSSSGIATEIITAQTPLEERIEIFKRFDRRETTILVSVGCLIAGFDAYVDCIIWAAPSKSRIKFLQGLGRGLRTAKGKDHCLIFDHAGTTSALGYIEDIDDSFDGLCSGDRVEAKAADIERETKVKAPKACPSCNYMKPAGVHECPKCGFAPRYGEDVDVDETRELVAISGKKKEPTMQEKELFWRECLGMKAQHKSNGKAKADGYYSNLYKSKFGVWPKVKNESPIDPSPATLNYAKSRAIAFYKSKEKQSENK